MFAARASRAPDSPALVEYSPGGGKAVWTHSEIHTAACTFASYLCRETELDPGSRVVISGPNSGRWIIACLGAHMAGMTVVPLDTEYSGAERNNIVSFVEAAAVVCPSSMKNTFGGSLPVIAMETLGTGGDYSTFEPRPLGEDQPFSIVFTSGSTDTPKGVMLSEENFLHNVNMLRTFEKLISSSDRLLSVLPLHHVYAFTVTMLLPLSVGACLVFPASLKPSDVGAAATGEDITLMAVVPQVINSLHHRVMQEVKARSFPARLLFGLMSSIGSIGIERGWRPGRMLFGSLHKKFGSLRFFACGGARLDPSVHRTVAALGFRVLEAYGLSETSPIVTLNHPDRPVFGSVGKPAPGVELKLTEIEGGIEDHEVLVHGPNVMTGYWKLPEATTAVLRDGWFRTGDLGRMDSEGNLFLTGRSKEVLVMPSGKNVYPEELEKIYAQGELIGEICICLTEHGGSEHLTAVVVPERDTIKRRKISAINEEVRFELENIGIRLPSYQRVTRIILTNGELPRTRLGKLQRFKVQKLLADELAAQSPDSEAERGDPDDRLLVFAARELELDNIPTGTENLETVLGLDSLNKLDFIAAAEAEFGFTLSGEEAASLVTLDDFRPFIGRETSGSAIKRDMPLEELVDMGNNWFWTFVRWGARLKLRAVLKLFFRARAVGLGNIPEDGAFLLAPNHVSYIDGLVVHAMVPGWLSRKLFSVATAEIFDRWPFHQISYRGRIIKTGTLETSARSLQHTLELLLEDHPVCVFPEGKRSADGRVDTPRAGVGLLATQTGTPVVPVYIEGTNNLLSRSNPGIHRSRITVHFLPPIRGIGGKDELLNEWIGIMQRMEAGRGRS